MKKNLIFRTKQFMIFRYFPVDIIIFEILFQLRIVNGSYERVDRK